jgi:hypothetical protein
VGEACCIFTGCGITAEFAGKTPTTFRWWGSPLVPYMKGLFMLAWFGWTDALDLLYLGFCAKELDDVGC